MLHKQFPVHNKFKSCFSELSWIFIAWIFLTGWICGCLHPPVGMVGRLFHKLGGLKQQECIISQYWKLEVWNEGVGRAMLPLEPVRGVLPCPSLLLVVCWQSSAFLSFQLHLSILCLHRHMTSSCACVCVSLHVPLPVKTPVRLD